MIELTLITLLMILIFLGLLESYFHEKSLSNLPIRIHVNGARGKSSVTRLIAAGLRSGGLKTLAKTTGTSPRIINANGEDREIFRLRSATIGEQVRLLRSFAKQKPEAVVIECMAVNPHYQWISEHKMIRSTIGVITNIRPDHLDEMGSTIEDNTMSISNTIPHNGTIVTVIDSENNQVNNILKRESLKKNTKLFFADNNKISSKFMKKFKYLEHVDNVSLAIEVCKQCGVNEKNALEGMLKSNPDPGATVVWNLNFHNNHNNNFVNLFAANDPSSTYNIFEQLKSLIEDRKVCIFLNTRDDRRYRTYQLLDLIFIKIKPSIVIIRGEKLPSILEEYRSQNPDIKVIIFSFSDSKKSIIKSFSEQDNTFIIGIGNIVGWGEDFIKRLKRYKS